MKEIKIEGKWLLTNEAKLLGSEFRGSLKRLEECKDFWTIGVEFEWFHGILCATFYVGSYPFLDAPELREYYLVLRKKWNRKFYEK